MSFSPHLYTEEMDKSQMIVDRINGIVEARRAMTTCHDNINKEEWMAISDSLMEVKNRLLSSSVPVNLFLPVGLWVRRIRDRLQITNTDVGHLLRGAFQVSHEDCSDLSLMLPGNFFGLDNSVTSNNSNPNEEVSMSILSIIKTSLFLGYCMDSLCNLVLLDDTTSSSSDDIPFPITWLKDNKLHITRKMRRDSFAQMQTGLKQGVEPWCTGLSSMFYDTVSCICQGNVLDRSMGERSKNSKYIYYYTQRFSVADFYDACRQMMKNDLYLIIEMESRLVSSPYITASTYPLEKLLSWLRDWGKEMVGVIQQKNTWTPIMENFYHHPLLPHPSHFVSVQK